MRLPSSNLRAQPLLAIAGMLAITLPVYAQRPGTTPGRPRSSPAARQGGNSSTAASSDPRKAFVLDVVQSAVAVPQSDPQDRLRVLAAAIPVSNSVDPKLSRSLAEEGAQIETQVIASGQTPVASVMQSGEMGCPAAQQFVDALPADAVERAQDSLLGALQSCPKTLPSIQRKLDEALKSDIVAPRALLAAMEASGFKSDWSQQQFQSFFETLPKPDGEKSNQQAGELANLYAAAASQVGKAAASSAGAHLLEWAGSMPEGSSRNHLVNVVTGTMREALGEEGYRKTLGSNIAAAQIAQTEGQPGEADSDAEENVSVLQAMDDREASPDKMSELPDTLRAREAAAHGFARGNDGDLKAAGQYFDVAFSALDSAWDARGQEEQGQNISDVVQEVSEAAAQVDPVAALHRAETLQNPAARAISMLSIAQVVLNRQAGLLPLRASR